MKKKFFCVISVMFLVNFICGCDSEPILDIPKGNDSEVVESSPEPTYENNNKNQDAAQDFEYEYDKEILEVSSTPVYEFGRCFKLNNGTLMTTTNAANNGDVVFSSNDFTLRALPVSVESVNMLASFTVYENRIYFLAHDPGSDPMPGAIYSCDMNGGDIKEITRNAYNYSDCYIKDGYIYYDGYKNLSEGEPDFFGGNIKYGIYKANLQGTYNECIVPEMGICYIGENGIICEGREPSKDGEQTEVIWRWTDFNGWNMKVCSLPFWMKDGGIMNGDGVIYTISEDGIILKSADGSQRKIKKPDESYGPVFHRISPYEIAYSIYSYEKNTKVLYKID